MLKWHSFKIFVFLFIATVKESVQKEEQYHGLYLGKFHTYAHQVSGEVYAVDEYTMLIQNFIYDGLGKDTFFWAGSTVRPSNAGFIVPDEEGRTNKLQRYIGKDLTIKLPDGRKLSSLKWLAVWDLRDHENFADIYIPEGFDPPSPQALSELSRKRNGVRSGAVTIMDSKSIFIPELYYDGNATDTYFWVGVGPQPSANGKRIPDGSGYLNALGKYDGEDVTLELPGELTVFEIDWISIWNIEENKNYGSALIPDGLNIPPGLFIITKHESRFPNCEQLHKKLQLNWEIFGPQITFELAGQIEEDDYIALGLSGSQNSSQMLGADVAISYLQGHLGITTDYNITGKFPCSNAVGLYKGVCPDTKVGGVDNFQIHTFVRNNGITALTYRRNLINTGDDGDQVYNTEGPNYFVWAVGKYNKFKEPGFHHLYPKGDTKLVLGRKPAVRNCYDFSSRKFQPKATPWKTYYVKDKGLTTFAMHLGPAAGEKGYQGLTGNGSPGYVWYVNGIMSPVIYVQRGKKYVFRVEGGNNPHNGQFYHPLYITDDPYGGYAMYDDKSRKDIKVYAGIRFDQKGRAHPTSAGRLCVWQYEKLDGRKADIFPSFSKLRDAMKMQCDKGDAATLQWTPNISTPNLLFYQSFTQRNMGWKIIVVDEIENSGSRNKACLLLFLLYFVNKLL